MNYYSKKTKFGWISIKENQGYITEVHWNKTSTPGNVPLIEEAFNQLEEYFNGNRTGFNLPLNPQGTEFQKLVWRELEKIPYGETRSYKDVAIAIGKPDACRAVGMANNKNPIGIIIPCHRVIGSNGNLTGYAGGLKIKEQLLYLESNSKIA